MTAEAPPRPPSTLGQATLIGRLDLRRRLRDRSILLQVFLAPILLALIVGVGAAIALYLLAFNLIPGGRMQLRSLAAELAEGLRRRTSSTVEERGEVS